MFVQVNRKKSMAEYLPAFLLTSPCNLLKLRMESRYRARAAWQHSTGPDTQTFSPGEVWDDHFGYRVKFSLDNLLTWDILQVDFLLYVMPAFPLTVTQSSNYHLRKETLQRAHSPRLSPSGPRRIRHSSIWPNGENITLISFSLHFFETIPMNNFRSSTARR